MLKTLAVSIKEMPAPDAMFVFFKDKLQNILKSFQGD